MKPPLLDRHELTDQEAEDLVVTAHIYRHGALRSCQVATLMWSLDQQRARWHVKDAARLIGKAGEIDGVGVGGVAS